MKYTETLVNTIAIAAIVSISASNVAYADYFSPSHSCSKPYEPYEFNSQSEVDDYNYNVDRYKRCIMDFVETQESESQNHIEAAQSAIDEWNDFARYGR